jgi:hypothetical protein
MPGVQESTDMIFYHGYDCGDQFGGWKCDGLNTTCPFIEQSAQLFRNYLDVYSPNRTIWMTELCYATEFGDYNVTNGCPALPRYDFIDGLQWGKMLFSDWNIVRANGWIYWNMILDTTGGPWLESDEHNDPADNVQQPVIIADPGTGTFYLTGCYYAMAHFGKFVKPNAHRIEATRQNGFSGTISSVAFVDEHKSKIHVILMNDNVLAQNVIIKYGPYSATVPLSPISFTTVEFTL